jgi:transcription elongation factor Elf1
VTEAGTSFRTAPPGGSGNGDPARKRRRPREETAPTGRNERTHQPGTGAYGLNEPMAGEMTSRHGEPVRLRPAAVRHQTTCMEEDMHDLISNTCPRCRGSSPEVNRSVRPRVMTCHVCGHRWDEYGRVIWDPLGSYIDLSDEFPDGHVSDLMHRAAAGTL